MLTSRRTQFASVVRFIFRAPRKICILDIYTTVEFATKPYFSIHVPAMWDAIEENYCLPHGERSPVFARRRTILQRTALILLYFLHFINGKGEEQGGRGGEEKRRRCATRKRT